MVRYLGWLANTALFTLCCFLVANTANAIIAALLSQSPAHAVELGPRSGPQNRSWSDREQITKRNLFHSAELSSPAAAAVPVPTDEELKETQLPLKLWGTISAEDPALSWASVEETSENNPIATVRVGDQIQNATIVGIERRRIVLLENGSRRSLSLDDEAEGSALASASRLQPPTRPTTSRSSRRASARSPRKPKTPKTESPVGNPSSLYSQARIVPEIDSETNIVTGLKLSAIQAGSGFEQAGISNGEVITEINGVSVSEMGDSTTIMAAIADQDEVEIVTRNQAGKVNPPRLVVITE